MTARHDVRTALVKLLVHNVLVLVQSR